MKKCFRCFALVFVMLVLCCISSVSASSVVNEKDYACLVNASNGISETDFVLVSTSSDLGNTYMYVGDSSTVYDLDLSGCEAIPSIVSEFSEIFSLNVLGLGLSDLSIVEAFPFLVEVNASNNNLTAIPTLPDMLEEIDLSNNAISDVSNLLEFLEYNPSLSFNISNNPISENDYYALREYDVALYITPIINSIKVADTVYTATSTDIHYITHDSILDELEIIVDMSYFIEGDVFIENSEGKVLYIKDETSFILTTNNVYEIKYGEKDEEEQILSTLALNKIKGSGSDDNNTEPPVEEKPGVDEGNNEIEDGKEEEKDEPAIEDKNENTEIDTDNTEENETVINEKEEPIDIEDNEIVEIEEEVVDEKKEVVEEIVTEPIMDELPYTASFNHIWYGLGLLFLTIGKILGKKSLN